MERGLGAQSSRGDITDWQITMPFVNNRIAIPACEELLQRGRERECSIATWQSAPSDQSRSDVQCWHEASRKAGEDQFDSVQESCMFYQCQHGRTSKRTMILYHEIRVTISDYYSTICNLKNNMPTYKDCIFTCKIIQETQKLHCIA